jgi:hypothetical protein
MDVGSEFNGAFKRLSIIEALHDAAVAWGNVLSYNPEHAYLAAGLPAEQLARSTADRCSRPIRLQGYYDWRYNPDGTYPVISFCDGNGPERGLFDPQFANQEALDIVLAVDLNDNGVRDSGEPLLLWLSERFDDVGIDGLADADEPGYDPGTNPDPHGDDHHWLLNPFGTEGNGSYDDGEPYLDYGLDGVAGTTDSPYDFGEGNGVFDLNPHIAERLMQIDPRSLLRGLATADRDRLDFYVDVGIFDHLRFKPVCESFIGVLNGLGRPVDIRDGFESLLAPDSTGGFLPAQIDWPSIGRDVFVRYGNPDASAQEIEDGDGGHVGSPTQVLRRFLTSVSFASTRWPGGDFEPVHSPGQVISASLASPVLGKDWTYLIYLPPGYQEQTDKTYPVLYMLHGIGMDAQSIAASSLLIDYYLQAGDIQKLIMVFPDGECQGECFSGTFYANQVGRPGDVPLRYEDAFIQELLPHIRSTYRVKEPADVPMENQHWAVSIGQRRSLPSR